MPLFLALASHWNDSPIKLIGMWGMFESMKFASAANSGKAIAPPVSVTRPGTTKALGPVPSLADFRKL